MQSVDADFFESGGNSLLGGRLIAKVLQARGHLEITSISAA